MSRGAPEPARGSRGARVSRMATVLARRFVLAEQLAQSRVGLSVTALSEATGASRATVYRDLRFLREMDVPVVDFAEGGETRYRIPGNGHPKIVPFARKAALDFAVQALGPLEGTRLHREMEALGAELGVQRERVARVVHRGSTAAAPILADVERAIAERRRAELDYLGVRDAEPRMRRVVPFVLRVVKGHVYLDAHDEEAGAQRVFKLARVRGVRVLGHPRERYRAVDQRGSVVVWRGALIAVRIRLGPEVARFAGEYPLVDGQRLEPLADGSVVVRAEVAGDEEVLRWVLGWGRHAEVLAPPALRTRVREELASASRAYAKANGKPAGGRPR